MTSHYLNQWWLVYWYIYASIGLNKLTHQDLNKMDSFSNAFSWIETIIFLLKFHWCLFLAVHLTVSHLELDSNFYKRLLSKPWFYLLIYQFSCICWHSEMDNLPMNWGCSIAKWGWIWQADTLMSIPVTIGSDDGLVPKRQTSCSVKQCWPIDKAIRCH